MNASVLSIPSNLIAGSSVVSDNEADLSFVRTFYLTLTPIHSMHTKQGNMLTHLTFLQRCLCTHEEKKDEITETATPDGHVTCFRHVVLSLSLSHSLTRRIRKLLRI